MISMPDHATTTPIQDDRFLLLCALGRGGMATVYRAYDRVEQRTVALKVCSDDAPSGPAHPFATEYEAWTRLRHPNVVRALGLATARRGPLREGTPYLVLEDVTGAPLSEALAPGRVPPGTVARLGAQVLAGLGHVHAAGLVHRDVKPANILVRDGADGRDERFKLTDFGLASPAGQADEPGRISGSLPYVAPESILGRRIDGRTDLYALGIVLFQMATGRLPLQACSAEDLLRWHLLGPPLDPRRERPRFPADLARLISRLTARDPAHRPADASEAMAALGGGWTAPAAATVGIESGTSGEASTTARLRLALDGARLGARRTFRLSGSTHERAPWARRLRVWAEMFGLAFHELHPEASAGEPSLLRLVLGLLLERGDGSSAWVERYGLDRRLPLTVVRGVPLIDRTRSLAADRQRTAVDVARFLIDCSAERGLVLLSRLPRGSCPLAREVVHRLVTLLDRPQPPCPGRGGLLVVTWEAPVVRRSATGRGSSARA